MKTLRIVLTLTFSLIFLASNAQNHYQQIDSIVAQNISKITFEYDSAVRNIGSLQYTFDSTGFVPLYKSKGYFGNDRIVDSISTEIFYNGSWDHFLATSIQYDSLGRYSVKYFYNWLASGYMINRTHYFYNQSGGLDTYYTLRIFPDGSIIDTLSSGAYYYNSLGNLDYKQIRMHYQPGLGIPDLLKLKCLYDAQNRLCGRFILRKYLSDTIWEYERKFTFGYNAAGSRNEMLEYEYSNGSWQPLYKHMLESDSLFSSANIYFPVVFEDPFQEDRFLYSEKHKFLGAIASVWNDTLGVWEPSGRDFYYYYSDIRNSIPENEKVTWKIYPNPTNDILNIESPDSRNQYLVRIYDVSGHLIRSFKLLGKQVDVSYLTKGMYFIQLSNGDVVLQKRLVKM